MTQFLTFQSRIPVPEPPAGWFAYAYAVTLEGHLGIMWTDCEVRALHKASIDENGAQGNFTIPTGARARIAVFDGTHLENCVEFPLVHLPYLQFDRLPDGRWVVASPYGRGPPAQVISGDGEASEINLGIGLGRLQCAPDGSIWTGHDAAVCFGEGDISDEGIAQISPKGKMLWGYHSDPRVQRHFVDYFEALNVGPQGVFGIIWPGYVIVQLDTPKPRFLRSRSECPEAFAAERDHFLIAGGYGAGQASDYFRVMLLGPPSHSGSRRLTRIWTGAIDRPPRDEERLIIGRGNCLHAVTDNQWLRITVDQALAQIPADAPRQWSNFPVEDDTFSFIVINTREPAPDRCPVVAIDDLSPRPRHWEPFGGLEGGLEENLTAALKRASWPTSSNESFGELRADPSLPTGSGSHRQAGYGRAGVFRFIRGEQRLWCLLPDFQAKPHHRFKVSRLNCTPNRLLFCIEGGVANGERDDSEVLPLTFFSTDQANVPPLLRSGMNLSVLLGLIAINCELVEAHTGHAVEPAIAPLAKLVRYGENADDCSPAVDAPRADEVDFVGTITSARKLRRPVAEAMGWQVMVSVHRWEDGSTLKLPILITERMWRYGAGPRRGQTISGRAWVQGSIGTIASPLT